MTAAPHHSTTSAHTEPEDMAQAAYGVLTETEKFILEMLERLDTAESKAEHLQVALQHSRDIGAAIGILMSQHKTQQDEAFALLRRCSQDQNRKLYDVAMDVLNTGELCPRGH